MTIEPSEDSDISLDSVLGDCRTSLPSATPKPSSSSVPPAPPGPPFLFVDIYAQDLGAKPPWAMAMDDCYGAIIKCTESTGGYQYTPWFIDNWKRLIVLAGERYGRTWFRGAYHFLTFAKSGAAQADYYLDTINKAGGWEHGDLHAIVDVELGGERNPNQRASAQQIIDCTSAFATRVKSVSGSKVILYGRGAMRDKEINSKMNCDLVWNPSYTERMVTNGLVTVDGKPGPWKLDEIVMWQFSGDGVGDSSVHHLPLSPDDFGKVDMSVYVEGANKPSLASMRSRLLR